MSQCCCHGFAVIFIKQKCIYAWISECASRSCCAHMPGTQREHGRSCQRGCCVRLWLRLSYFLKCWIIQQHTDEGCGTYRPYEAVFQNFASLLYLFILFFCIYCIITCSFCVFKKMRVSFYLRGGINFEVPASESLLQRRSGCAWTPFTSVWALKELRPSTLWCEFSKRHETTA